MANNKLKTAVEIDPEGCLFQIPEKRSCYLHRLWKKTEKYYNNEALSICYKTIFIQHDDMVESVRTLAHGLWPHTKTKQSKSSIVSLRLMKSQPI